MTRPIPNGNHGQPNGQPLQLSKPRIRINLMICTGMHGRISQEACLKNQIIAERAAKRCLAYDYMQTSYNDHTRIPTLTSAEIDRLKSCRKCRNCVIPELLQEAVNHLDAAMRAAFNRFERSGNRSQEQIKKDRKAKSREYYWQNKDRISKQRKIKRRRESTTTQSDIEDEQNIKQR